MGKDEGKDGSTFYKNVIDNKQGQLLLGPEFLYVVNAKLVLNLDLEHKFVLFCGNHLRV